MPEDPKNRKVRIGDILITIGAILYGLLFIVFAMDLHDFLVYPERYAKFFGGAGPHAGAWAYKSSTHYILSSTFEMLWILLGICLAFFRTGKKKYLVIAHMGIYYGLALVSLIGLLFEVVMDVVTF